MSTRLCLQIVVAIGLLITSLVCTGFASADKSVRMRDVEWRQIVGLLGWATSMALGVLLMEIFNN